MHINIFKNTFIYLILFFYKFLKKNILKFGFFLLINMKQILIKKLSIKINAFILSCFIFNLNYVFSDGCCDCLSSNS